MAINVIIIIVVSIIVCPMMIIYRRIELLLWDGKMCVKKAAAKGNDSHDSCLMMTLRTEMIIWRRGNFLMADSGLFGICLWCWKGCDRTSSLLNLPFRCLYSVFWMVCLVLWTVNSIFLMIFNRGWIFVFWMVIMLFVMIIWFLKWHTSCVLNCGFGILGDILDIWDWDQSWFGLRSLSLSWVPSLPGLQVNRVEQTNTQIYKYTNIQIYKSTKPVSPVCKLIGWSRRQKSYSNTSLLTFPILLPPFYCAV